MVAVLLCNPAPVFATTGGQPLENLPIYGLTPSQAAPYLGRFKAQGDGQPLISASLGTKFTVSFQGRSVVQGTIAVTQYDGEGRPSTWVATTYEYHDVGKVMHIDIWSPDGRKLLGRLYLHQGGQGSLVGQMRVGAKHYPVSFARRGSALAPDPEPAGAASAPGRDSADAGTLAPLIEYVSEWLRIALP
jgi:hypothetical protein